MQLISILFLKVAGMGLKAGIVTGVVLLVRLLLRGLPRSYAYVLWAAVAFRLIIPFSADSDISIFNLFVRESVSSESSGNNDLGMGAEQGAGGFHITDEGMADAVGRRTGQDGSAQNDAPDAESDTESSAIPFLQLYNRDPSGRYRVRGSIFNGDSFVSILAVIWIAGILVLVSYTLAVHVQIRRRTRYSIRLCGNVYECDRIRSPFVSGLVRPRIYLPFRLCGPEQHCILAHERYHIARRDYLVKSFAYLLVIVYWFQPLVWIAYRQMCIDMEMSCDEKVISGFTDDMRKEYSRLLLAFAANKRQLPVSPLAFGEENIMKRIKNILHYKKAAQWRLAGGAAVVMLTMAACATDASTGSAVLPVSDGAALVESEGGIQNSAVDNADNNNGNGTVVVTNGTSVTTHHAEQHHMDGYSGEQHHIMEHHPAQWAGNSMCDMELCSLDYADPDRIIFHISNGLFQYDLQEQRIIRSIDLKALNCQEVQTGGKCKVAVYQDSDGRLRVVVRPYPYSDEDAYVYDPGRDELFAYDEGLLERYVLYDGLVSKHDLPEEEQPKGWRHAEYILSMEDSAGKRSYGILCWESLELGTIYYEAGGQKWELFHEEQATLPRLLKQDDSFYQSVVSVSESSVSQCMLDYQGFYNGHDYAGVCALSTGLEYSDEMQRVFSGRSDELLLAEEVSHSEDGTEYLFRFSYRDGNGADGSEVYVNFRYMDGVGWRAEGLPRMPEEE